MVKSRDNKEPTRAMDSARESIDCKPPLRRLKVYNLWRNVNKLMSINGSSLHGH